MDVQIKSLTLLPAAASTCSECATEHDPALPHNQGSLFWQMRFHQVNGRWPTWADAMAHCAPEVQALWSEALETEREVHELEIAASEGDQMAKLRLEFGPEWGNSSQ